MSKRANLNLEYELLDTGDNEKLERFGDHVIRRPSSLCIWRKRRSALWATADATYVPKGENGGWRFRGKEFGEWEIALSERKLKLRLQTNGQVGVFPEHASYLSRLGEILWALDLPQPERPKVLNLFAYSGMATVFAAHCGAHVCHVDLAKKSLDWARSNLELNKISSDQVRFICDDAVKFSEKEAKRGASYDVVIADPPSFSRISGSKSWKLEEILPRYIETLSRIVKPGGAVFLSCHVTGIYPELLENLAADYFATDEDSGVATSAIRSEVLKLKESGATGRVVPSGALVTVFPANLKD